MIKLKAFSDNKLNIGKVMISVLGRVENNVGKGESVADQQFLLSHSVFQSLLLQGHLKSGLCGTYL